MYLYGHGCWTDFVKWASESWRFVVCTAAGNFTGYVFTRPFLQARRVSLCMDSNSKAA